MEKPTKDNLIKVENYEKVLPILDENKGLPKFEEEFWEIDKWEHIKSIYDFIEYENKFYIYVKQIFKYEDNKSIILV